MNQLVQVQKKHPQANLSCSGHQAPELLWQCSWQISVEKSSQQPETRPQVTIPSRIKPTEELQLLLEYEIRVEGGYVDSQPSAPSWSLFACCPWASEGAHFIKNQYKESVFFGVSVGPEETEAVPKHPQIYQRHNHFERTNERCLPIREEKRGDYFLCPMIWNFCRCSWPLSRETSQLAEFVRKASYHPRTLESCAKM